MLRPFFRDLTMKISWWAMPLWVLLPLLIVFTKILRGPSAYNNYLMYKGVFSHLVSALPLYVPYPLEYADVNHYGPSFGMLMAPFALLPDGLGMMLWMLLGVFVLGYALLRLPIRKTYLHWMTLLVGLEMLTAVHNLQFNILLSASMLLAFQAFQKQQGFWMAFWLCLGIFTKIYSLAFLVFFLFSPDRKHFLLSIVLMGVAFFALPLCCSDWTYLWQTYQEWLPNLIQKNQDNTQLNGMQNISFFGLVQRIFALKSLPVLPILGLAVGMALIPLKDKFLWKDRQFQAYYFCFLMLSIVLFSTSSESPSYIIAMVGFMYWYVMEWEQGRPRPWLMVLALIFTVLSPTDLFPVAWRQGFFVKYSLKALPMFLAWCLLWIQLLGFSKLNTNISDQSSQ